MTDEWHFLYSILFIAFWWRFLVELPLKSSWLILSSDGVIFYTDGSLCEGRVGADVFSVTLDIRESYALGSLATVFQTEVYAILACSDYSRSVNMHNMTICICSDSKAALLALSSYIQFRLNFYTSAGYHSKISLITTGWDYFGCQVTATLRAMRRLIGWLEWARTPIFVDQSLVSASIVRDMNENGSLTHTLNTGSHLTAVDNLSFGLKIEHPNLQTTKLQIPLESALKNSSEFWFLLSRDIVALINISTRWDWQQALFVHLVNWKRRRHFTLCVSVPLLLHWEHAFLASP
jgi:hypothetical protein